MLVASNISGAAEALGLEEIELCSCLIRFGCVLDELTVVISDFG